MSDELLERAIASYSAEPRSGLEGRVLEQVYARNRRRRHAALLWLPVAAGLLLVIARPHPAPPLPQIARLMTAIVPVPEPATRLLAAHKRRTPVKQSVFPTPVFLTDGEKALLSLMQQHPETWSQVTTRQNSDVLEIAPLEVQPLKSDVVQ